MEDEVLPEFMVIGDYRDKISNFSVEAGDVVIKVGEDPLGTYHWVSDSIVPPTLTTVHDQSPFIQRLSCMGSGWCLIGQNRNEKFVQGWLPSAYLLPKEEDTMFEEIYAYLRGKM